MIEPDIIIECPSFDDKIDWEAIAHRAVIAALHVTSYADAISNAAPIDLAIRLIDDATMQTLNRCTRGINRPTNVLSFQYLSPHELDEVIGRGGTLGDLALAYGKCKREARDQGKPFESHIAHLIVHGTLHLLGYDHEQDDEAEVMEALERKAMERLGIADPYMVSHGDA